jgi:P-type E1-E2 ATPase
MRDELRQESAEIVATLKMMDISHIAMVTGDLATTAKPLAKKLGIRTLHAECTPADKVSFVAAMKPRPLMMVGDGLNDAPVLAAADVGFAMGARGATAASESADIVNRADSIRGIPVALQIGRDTVRIALQSIWIGIIISTILMGIAAFGSLPALAGAWLQEGVDLVAILWALRAARTTNK